eukprot:scaffold7109_cov63-Phaeocystis_antarctica.AAC.6
MVPPGRAPAPDRAASRHGLALVSEHDLAEPLHRALRRRPLAHLGGWRLLEAAGLSAECGRLALARRLALFWGW